MTNSDRSKLCFHLLYISSVLFTVILAIFGLQLALKSAKEIKELSEKIEQVSFFGNCTTEPVSLIPFKQVKQTSDGEAMLMQATIICCVLIIVEIISYVLVSIIRCQSKYVDGETEEQRRQKENDE